MPTKHIGLICTMPKSGTWYCHYFFYFYTKFLGGMQQVAIPSKGCPEADAKRLNLDYFRIIHSDCLGIAKYKGRYSKEWNALNYYVPQFNQYEHLQPIEIKPYLDPTSNPTVRLIYIYRNPLDQAVSYFRHMLNHKQDWIKKFSNELGQEEEISDVNIYIRNVGGESYVKQYISWRIMKAIFPRNILMLTYEDLFREPDRTFTRILNFFAHDPSTDTNVPHFKKSLENSSIDTMKNIENILGRSLGDDQKDPNERHVRDGKIGKWKEHVSPEAVQSLERRLNVFNVSLAEFTLE